MYGGLPDTAFQAWLAAQVPPLNVQEQPWGLQLHIPGGLDKVALRGWCVAQQALATQSSTPATSGREGTTEGTLVMVQQQILKELNQLALATCTPMQAMQWLARWQGLAVSSPQAESGGEG
ncbi:hypothetical protein DK261_23460 [Pseudomonas sp. RW409]|nr:hypothetical protein DK261_23460 [Pseudomonas sp. RW409]